jgi:hypothetical protein
MGDAPVENKEAPAPEKEKGFIGKNAFGIVGAIALGIAGAFSGSGLIAIGLAAIGLLIGSVVGDKNNGMVNAGVKALDTKIGEWTNKTPPAPATAMDQAKDFVGNLAGGAANLGLLGVAGVAGVGVAQKVATDTAIGRGAVWLAKAPFKAIGRGGKVIGDAAKASAPAVRYVISGGRVLATRVTTAAAPYVVAAGEGIAAGAAAVGTTLAESATATTVGGLATAGAIGVGAAAVITAPVAIYTSRVWAENDEFYKFDPEKFRNLKTAEGTKQREIAAILAVPEFANQFPGLKLDNLKNKNGKYDIRATAVDSEGQERMIVLEALTGVLEKKKDVLAETMEKNDYWGPRWISGIDGFGLGKSWSVDIGKSSRGERIANYQQAVIEMREADSALAEMLPFTVKYQETIIASAAKAAAEVKAQAAVVNKAGEKRASAEPSIGDTGQFASPTTPAKTDALAAKTNAAGQPIGDLARKNTIEIS